MASTDVFASSAALPPFESGDCDATKIKAKALVLGQAVFVGDQ